MIDIEESALSTFQEQTLAREPRLIDRHDRIADKRLDVFDGRLKFRPGFFRIQFLCALRDIK